MRKALLAACAGILFALPASAKDMSGSWGIGFTRGFDVTGISVRHWMDKQLGFEGILGYRLLNRDNGPDARAFELGGRFLINLVQEQNMHVYGGAGLSLLHRRFDDNSDNGVGAEVFTGAEFFFQGLPNLGFSAELGIDLTDTKDTTTFGTFGGSFVSAGIRYYF
jgi:hypothetical protein